MNERATAFCEAVSADDALHAELVEAIEGVDVEDIPLREARVAAADAIADFAAAHDLDLAAADILDAQDDILAEGELSEDELKAVAGGTQCGCAIIGMLKGCGCFLAGGSSHGTTTVSCEIIG